MRIRSRWLLGVPCLAVLVVACSSTGPHEGGGGGSSGSHATGGSGGTGGGAPGALARITVQDPSASVVVGKNRTFVAVATDRAGTVLRGLTFAWASSDDGVATVRNGIVTGVAAGVAGITASSGGVTSAPARILVTVTGPPDADPTSEELIDRDLGAGLLTEEQAFVYRVYAAWGSPELPPAYRGLVTSAVDPTIEHELALRADALSAEAKAAVEPYRIPPIYVGSWGDPALLERDGGHKPFDEPMPTACRDGALPGLLPDWTQTTTTHFRIWWQTANGGDLYTPEQAATAASNVAAVAEHVYDELTTFFGQEPIGDEHETCNGGDGRIDVYMTKMEFSAAAKVSTYPPGCNARPTWMWLSPLSAGDPKEARDVFTHEFMHMIQFAYSRAASCDDYTWLDEAMANWAVDHVYKDDQFEQDYAPCYYDREFDVPIESSGTRYLPCNGYSDYVLFLFLDRKYSPATIKSVLDQTRTQDSRFAVDKAVGGGLKKVWPEFALAGINGWQDQLQDDFYRGDRLEAGAIQAFAKDPDHHVITRVQLGGAPQKTIPLGYTYFYSSGDSRIDPMSARYVYLEFPDESVRSIVYQNKPGALGPAAPHLHVDAIAKVGGVWRAPEDWTAKPFPSFCRDRQDERVEALLVVYSNSDPARPADDTAIRLDGFGGGYDFLPEVQVSNAGCWKWEGTSSITSEATGTPATIASATVTFERSRSGVLPDGGAGMDLFTTTGGTASYSQNGPFLEVCTVSTDSPGATIGPQDGAMTIVYDRPDDPKNRTVLTGNGTTRVSVTVNLTCPDAGTSSNTHEQGATWMQLPEDAKLSDDGQTIAGKHVDGMAGFSTTTEWNLHAVRE
jgi:hypothetical protein